MSPALKDLILRQLDTLPESQQRCVLDFLNTLPRRTEPPGRNLVALAGTISPQDLRLMTSAIENGCERIDQGEW